MSIISTRWRYLAGVIVLLVVSMANAELLINDGYVRGLPPGQPNTAAFMRLTNTGDKPLIINGAFSGSAKSAEFHAHQHTNGLMRMQQVDSITIPAGEEFVLAPGDHHLMLLDLLKPLREGDQVKINLQTSDGQLFSKSLPVRSVLNEHQH